VRIAELAEAIGALTRAEEAAGRAGAAAGAQKIVADVEATRHRIALPLDAAKVGVPPEREPAYVSGFWQTARQLDAAVGDLGPARARLGELATAFPTAPGVEVLTCDLELKAKHTAVAARHCEAALEKFKGATRAHYLLAVIALRARREAIAEQHLRQAILLDPTDPSSWRALAQLYRNTGASRRLSELASQHQALLSSPLPE
jgi:predicted Zn-dependent protease